MNKLYAKLSSFCHLRTKSSIIEIIDQFFHGKHTCKPLYARPIGELQLFVHRLHSDWSKPASCHTFLHIAIYGAKREAFSSEDCGIHICVWNQSRPHKRGSLIICIKSVLNRLCQRRIDVMPMKPDACIFPCLAVIKRKVSTTIKKLSHRSSNTCPADGISIQNRFSNQYATPSTSVFEYSDCLFTSFDNFRIALACHRLR